jgi:hypothetical protein
MKELSALLTVHGHHRFCVDYRKLNDLTVKQNYPIPRIEDCLDELSQAKYFSKIDCRTGYWQFEIDKDDKHKTAFIYSQGLFEYNVMPFGLTNAPATFQRFIDELLAEEQLKFCLIYIDDIIIYSKTFEEHLLHLDVVLNKIASANLRLKLPWTHYFQARNKAKS